MDIVVCDDEPLARDRLKRLLETLGHQVVAEAADGQQALQAVAQHQPDVVMLDIRMPVMDGLSCARQLSQLNTPPAIIFCTAYDQYAIEAFQTHAIAYLLKPTSRDDLAQALQRATRLTQAQVHALEAPHAGEHGRATADLSATMSADPSAGVRRHGPTRQHIMARTYRGIELIAVDDIYYFLADQKYVMVRHRGGQVLIDETLKDLEAEFADRFIRIHRNALLSLRYLDGLEILSNGQYQARCREIDEKLLISRRHWGQIRERMQQI